jgi:4-amino-4-deoxy-L-arabinose transferase-like glycosyltransferase
VKLILNNNSAAIAFIIFLASVVFIPFIGNCPLFDWDEINFAECAREMIVTGDYSQVQLNYNQFWEKPPGFIWMQAISMNIFGVNEFAARFPNALCGVISLVVIYLIGKKTNSPAFGLTWALVYAGTILPHFYFKSGIIDPWFNLFIFLSFYQALLHLNNPVGDSGTKSALLTGFFLGLAVLTKGPAALVIMGAFAAVYLVLKRFSKVTTLKFLLIFLGSLLITGCSWFIIELLKGNSHIIKAFFEYQVRLLNTEDSDHGGFLLYHFVVLLIGCFPTSLLFILSLKRSQTDTPYQKHIKLGMIILFFVVLIIFTLVKTKIVHYSSLCYFPLTYLACYSIFKLLGNEFQLKMWFKYLFIVLGSVIGIAFTMVGMINKLRPWILKNNLIDDNFAVENLKAEVHWAGWEWLLGLTFIIATVSALFYVSRGKAKAFYYLYGYYTIFIMTCVATLAPKIEQYSQDAVLEFYKWAAGRNYYLETSGFKSYAHLFYGKKEPQQNQNPDAIKYINEALDKLESSGHNRLTSYSQCYMNWMQFGAIDRPAFIVCKQDMEQNMLENPKLKKLYSKNGFVFLMRLPDTQP